ncbi:MAG: hypothetical protein ABSG36_12155 [Acidimicrobiales bacterium]|jgi:hypothetical protein
MPEALAHLPALELSGKEIANCALRLTDHRGRVKITELGSLA